MDSLPLHHCTLNKLSTLINRSHTLIQSILLTFILYYRLSSLLHHTHPLFLPHLIIFTSELSLSFLFLLRTAYGWKPVSRTVFPERLPDDKELPAIDIFICTADVKKEPPLGVMNTVLSVMALDYPPEKLSVYLSDDGRSPLMLYAVIEAWGFGKMWVRFCRKYGVKCRCPEGYFLGVGDEVGGGGGDGGGGTSEFGEERKKIERKYEQFKERLSRAEENGEIEDTFFKLGHSPVIQVIGDENSTSDEVNYEKDEMPLLVYVSREKIPSHPHHFKAGALNVLLRVSGILSNSPYILVLDCDMYSNDPTSARQAMCFHLDKTISSSLAFVQFPQKFHNISKTSDIYDSGLRTLFLILWPGMDGLKGPVMSGTGFYIKRVALYDSDIQKGIDHFQLKQSFGPSNEFIKSLNRGYKHNAIDNDDLLNTLLQETKFLASSTYEKDSQWGQQIGFLYHSVVEDYFTSFMLHCKGWTSIFCNPLRAGFLGTVTTNLNDAMVQGTRWNSGLLEVGFSKFSPLFYGLSRMTLLEAMCYSYLAFQPLYGLPVWCLGTIPQLCLLNGIPIYPKASSLWFLMFALAFILRLVKDLWDVLYSGGTIQTWLNEWRIWMIKSVTAYFYGTLDTIMKLVGLRQANFLPTNKVADNEQFKRYQMGIFDFQCSTAILTPLVTLVIVNMVSFVGGIGRVMVAGGGWSKMFGQIFLSCFILVVNWPIVEGMILRKDKGRVPPSVVLLSAVFSLMFLALGSIFLIYMR